MNKDVPTNSEIRVKEVRLIDSDGSMLGIFPTAVAREKAMEKNLDLVLISPNANPPVCKILDYNKFKYEQAKRLKEERKKQTFIQVRDIWLSATIDVGDLNTKAKKAREFIEDGDKVRLSIRMRGRQLAHPEQSIEVMKDFYAKLSDISEMESAPIQQGRSVYMTLAPLTAKAKK